MGDPAPEADIEASTETASRSPKLRSADLISDRAVALPFQDRLRHNALASELAALSLAVEPPSNIALYGSWGSGKTSLSKLIQGELRGSSAGFVYYNAWKFGGGSLRKNFISNAARELGFSRRFNREFYDGLYTSRRSSSLPARNIFRGLVGLALGFTCIAFLVSVVTLLVLLVLAAVQDVSLSDKLDGLSVKVPIAGAAVSAAIGVLAMVAGGSKREEEISAPSDEEEFSDRFRQLVTKELGGRLFSLRRFWKWLRRLATYKKSFAGWALHPKSSARPTFPVKPDRVVFFVDELDRCNQADVVSTLTAIRTFLDEESCVFFVAADRDKLETALKKELGEAAPANADTPYYSTSSEFLDKIFSHQVALPPMRGRRLTRFARDLAQDQDDGGVWAELEESLGQRGFDEVIYALIPAHVRSPRRTKVLLNSFATNARIAQSRGIDWLPRSREIAKLTVLQVEFSNVAEDLHLEPGLLDWILTDGKGLVGRQEILFNRHRVGEEESEESPSEVMATEGDPDDDQESREAISKTIRLELKRFLERTSDIDGPRRDLIYLEDAGHVFNLGDAELGEFIEDVAPEKPRVVASRIGKASINDQNAAIRLLIDIVEDTIDRDQQNVLRVIAEVIPALDSELSLEAATAFESSLRWVVSQDEELPSFLTVAAISSMVRMGEEAHENAIAERDDFWEEPGATNWMIRNYSRISTSSKGRLRTALGKQVQARPDRLLSALEELDEDSLEVFVSDPMKSAARQVFRRSSDSVPSDTEVDLEERDSEFEDPAADLSARVIDWVLEEPADGARLTVALKLLFEGEADLVYAPLFENRSEILDVLRRGRSGPAEFILQMWKLSGPGDWTEWSNELESCSNPSSDVKRIGVEVLCRLICETNQQDVGASELAETATALASYLSSLSESEQGPLMGAIRDALGTKDSAHAEDGRSSRENLHAVIRGVAEQLPDLKKDVDAALVDDLIGGLHEDGANLFEMIRGIETMGQHLDLHSVQKLLESLPEIDPETQIHEFTAEVSARAVLTKVASVQSGGVVSSPFGVNAARARKAVTSEGRDAGDAFSNWLALAPPFSEIRSSVLQLTRRSAFDHKALGAWYTEAQPKQRSALLKMLIDSESSRTEVVRRLPEEKFEEVSVAAQVVEGVTKGSTTSSRKVVAQKAACLKFSEAAAVKKIKRAVVWGLGSQAKAKSDIGIAAILTSCLPSEEIPENWSNKFEKRCKKLNYKLTEEESKALKRSGIEPPKSGVSNWIRKRIGF